MPELDHPGAAACVINYPKRLDEFPVAFAGTLVSQRQLLSSELAARGGAEEHAAPFEVVVRVDEDYTGKLGKMVGMRGWDFNLETGLDRHFGEKYLIATTDDMNFKLCGYTRPFNEQDRDYWSSVFSSRSGEGGDPYREEPSPLSADREAIDETPYFPHPEQLDADGNYTTPPGLNAPPGQSGPPPSDNGGG